jgi:hypothetical protein
MYQPYAAATGKSRNNNSSINDYSFTAGTPASAGVALAGAI